MCVSRIMRKRINDELDEDCIIQPGRDIPKDHYLRRRAYTKQHKAAWEAAIKKYKHVKCIFQNCHFLALSVEDMMFHFGYCNGDGSFAKFTCPYCEGQVTSEKILEIHIRRSHEYEQCNIINNHFLDMRQDSTESIQSEEKQFKTNDNEFRTLAENVVVDVKIEGMGGDYDEDMVTQSLLISEKHVSDNIKNLDHRDPNACEKELNCREGIEVEESIQPEIRGTDSMKPGENEKCYGGDHIYFKRGVKIMVEDGFDSISVMKTNNLKHYSGPRNISEKISTNKVEGGPIFDLNFIKGKDSVMEKEKNSLEKQNESDNEFDNAVPFSRSSINFSVPSVQNVKRKIYSSYSYIWIESIKTNGFARCLVATCNFISLDIFHVQNHFKTCSGVPANGPNLCTLCNSWLPSAIELSIHSERCKTYRALTESSLTCGEVNGEQRDVSHNKNSEKNNPKEQTDSLDVENCENGVPKTPKPDPFQMGNDKKNNEVTESVSKNKKPTTLRISDIIKLKESGKMDINRIVQPGPELPKDQYLRRRAYTKQHRAAWEAAIKRYKHIICIFQNCYFVAMSVEDMIYHFGYCIGDGSFAKFQCPHCYGRLTSKMILDIHIKMSHPEMVTTHDIEEDSVQLVEEEKEESVYDILSSVEELKKLVTPKEIKTYGRNSIRSKKTRPKKPDLCIKGELYVNCWNIDEPLSCADVTLERNQATLHGSALINEQNTTEANVTSNIADRGINSVEEIDGMKNDEQREEQNGSSNKSISDLECNVKDGNSKFGKSFEKSDSMSEGTVVNNGCESQNISTAENENSLIGQNVISIKEINCVKNCENPPEEVEDPGTSGSASDQVKERGQASERKGQSNARSNGERSLTRRESKDENNDSSSTERSSRRSGRNEKSYPHSPGKKSESKENHLRSGRGAKRKSVQQEEITKCKIESNPKIAKLEVIEEDGRIKPPRKRGRPPRNSSAASPKPVEDEKPIPEPIPDIVQTGKRGRKRRNEETNDQMDGSIDNSEVKCAKCDFTAKREKFSHHNFRKHTGLSWIEGETPLDLKNEEIISSRVKQAFRVVKSATCETCNDVKRSALGFISHIQNCGKSEEEKQALKVSCPYCPSRVLKYSLPMHLKLSHSDSPSETSKTEEEESEVLTKRRSAIRAANKFQEVLKHSDDEDESKNKALYVNYEKDVSKFPRLPIKIGRIWKKMMKEKKKIFCCREGCVMESTNVQEAKRHHFTCSKLPEKSYMCQLCDYYSTTEDNIREHVNIHLNADRDFTVGSEEEKVEEEADPVEVDESADLARNKSRIPENALDALEADYKLKFFTRENLVNGRQTRFFKQSLRMTLKYELEEMKDVKIPLSELHTNIKDWISQSMNSIHDYLPNQKESMMFAVTRNQKKTEGPWKKLNRFEGEIVEGVPIIFTGGNVLSMSWCKYSTVRSFKEKPRQYLAVSSSKDTRTFQNIHEVPEVLSGCIQIWDCGELKSTLEAPKLAIGIIHDSGQVWDLSWFPIDTYEERGNTRIGLLGAACQDGTIRIWSICNPQKLKNKFKLPLYRIEPNVILQQEDEGRVGCLRLAVGKTGIIVGGFANGMVAVWNLKAIVSPFCRRINKSFILKPYLSFQAHRTSITALSICSTSDRYISTSGLDRFLRVWDLECTSNPIESTLREVCLDIAWPQHWPVTISMFDDVIPCTSKGMVKAIRDAYCDKHRAPLTMSNTCWSLSVNDWMNIICCCNNEGEVKIRFMRNMFMSDEYFRLRNGHVFSATDLILLNGNKESENDNEKEKMNTKMKNSLTYPRTYEESHRFFGLIFKDSYSLREDPKQKNESKKKVKSCLDEYPITSINKLSWNPNFGSFKFLAIGHQSGFVRIRQLEDIRCEEEVNRFFIEANDIIGKL